MADIKRAYVKAYAEYPYLDSLPAESRDFLKQFISEFELGFFEPGKSHLHHSKELKTKVSRSRDSKRRCFYSNFKRISLKDE